MVARAKASREHAPSAGGLRQWGWAGQEGGGKQGEGRGRLSFTIVTAVGGEGGRRGGSEGVGGDGLLLITIQSTKLYSTCVHST
eukprot:SAG31_NODE_38499_length_295_cov_1.831633_1_plen_83_part_10